jgi:large subunit ribosomal protein L10
VAREDKARIVDEIKARFTDADAVFITEFAGLTVGEQQALRRGLREGQTDYRVLKMSLTRRAITGLEVSDALDELLTGPTALAFTRGDPVAAAKMLKAFASEHEALSIKGMLFAGEVLAPEKVSELAALDSREVMLSRVAGMLAAPMSQMAGLMAAFTRNAASMFLQLRDKLEARGDPNADAAPPPAEAAPSEDAATEAPAAETVPAAVEAPVAEAESPPEEAAAADEDQPDNQPQNDEAAEADNDQPDDAGEEE